ncbi:MULTISPECIES: CRTAC1 family protein [Haloferax]|uniref:CRTAC1 family protein n=1 Tax=Haloferax marinum TaxID=2666143 RepID=A0A6A8G9D2_9EURY|nr:MULTISPECIES: CRTAC1 family protein [Haloferax]KAB1197833.1 CRTAC1 family protein [Haloferax sp. CBA1150]MRW96893.1 CRTAC1 family protein [Haloferax marinum]
MDTRLVVTVGLVLAVVLAGVTFGPSYLEQSSAEPEAPRLAFTDVTEQSGLDYEAVGSGVGSGNSGVYVADVNRDSWPDLLTIGGDSPALFVNEGGEFVRADVLPSLDQPVKSAVFLDVEGDGWTDLFLFTEDGSVVAFRNDGGEFVRTEYGVGNLSYPLGATAADYDQDGDTDLFVYQSGPWSDRKPAGYFSLDERITEDNGNPNYLYENVDGEFQRVDSANISGNHWSLAASFADLTGDGYPDIHVANDYNNDTLYVNTGDGTFDRRTLGGSTARNGMSSEVADVTDDGRPDVFVSNIWFPKLKGNMSTERYERLKRLLDFVIHSGRTKGNTLLVNQGNGEFVDSADELGVRHGGWGWAASATDFDNDGDRDMLHTTQVVVRIDRDDPVYTYPMVFQQRGDGFTRVNATTHGMHETDGRGLATLDFDHDGEQELVVATYDDSFVVYDNEVDTADHGSLQLRVVDEDGATALGSVVTVRTDTRTHVVQQTANVDYLSQDSRVEHVGVGDHETVTLEVNWPDGTTRTFEDVAVDQRLRVTKSGLVVDASLNETG